MPVWAVFSWSILPRCALWTWMKLLAPVLTNAQPTDEFCLGTGDSRVPGAQLNTYEMAFAIAGPICLLCIVLLVAVSLWQQRRRHFRYEVDSSLESEPILLPQGQTIKDMMEMTTSGSGSGECSAQSRMVPTVQPGWSAVGMPLTCLPKPKGTRTGGDWGTVIHEWRWSTGGCEQARQSLVQSNKSTLSRMGWAFGRRLEGTATILYWIVPVHSMALHANGATCGMLPHWLILGFASSYCRPLCCLAPIGSPCGLTLLKVLLRIAGMFWFVRYSLHVPYFPNYSPQGLISTKKKMIFLR